MEIFKEISNLISIIIWPLIVLILGFAFRDIIKSLLLRIKGAKYKDITFEFQDSLQENEALFKVKEKTEDINLNPIEINKIKELAELSSRALISESWSELENEILKILKNKDIQKKDFYKYLDAYSLANSYIIKYSDIPIYNNFRKMRNDVIHNYDSNVTKDQAIEYSLSIKKFIEIMKKENNEIEENA
jgi:hypothetical protein